MKYWSNNVMLPQLNFSYAISRRFYPDKHKKWLFWKPITGLTGQSREALGILCRLGLRVRKPVRKMKIKGSIFVNNEENIFSWYILKHTGWEHFIWNVRENMKLVSKKCPDANKRRLQNKEEDLQNRKQMAVFKDVFKRERNI